MPRVGLSLQRGFRVMNRPVDPREECECRRGRIAGIPDPREQDAFTEAAVAAVTRGEGIPVVPPMRRLCDLCARKAGWIK